MLPWSARQSDSSTLMAIENVNDDIRLLASEERLLRQELGLPPVTLVDDPRWTLEAPVSERGTSSRPRRRWGRSAVITIAVQVAVVAAAVGVGAGLDVAPADPADHIRVPSDRPAGSVLQLPGDCVVRWLDDGIILDGCDELAVGLS